MKKFSLLLLALALTPGLAAQAKDDAGQSPAAYFNPATLDPRAVLAPPAKDQSDATEKELEVILQKQADRTPQQLEQIKGEEHYSVFTFGNATGDWLSKDSIDKLPLTTGLLSRVMTTVKPIVAAAKGDWNRPRPFMINSRIYPPIDRPTDSSYPSAHAARAVLDSLVLSVLAPDEAKAIMARGQQVGDDRVNAGVEYPSDLAAGGKLARAVFDRLMADPQFVADLKAARAEVVAARKKGI